MDGHASAAEGTPEEREVKLAVAADFALPELTELPGASVHDAGEKRLQAVYWDSTGLALAGAGVGVRHRNGMWTYKGRSRREGDAVVRAELEMPGDEDCLPQRIRDAVDAWVDPAVLHPVAELDTVRHVVDVRAGAYAVELVHDHVGVVAGTRQVSSFDEVEVEFAQTSQELADRVVGLLLQAGAVIDPTPKLVRALRALGHEPPDMAL